MYYSTTHHQIHFQRDKTVTLHPFHLNHPSHIPLLSAIRYNHRPLQLATHEVCEVKNRYTPPVTCQPQDPLHSSLAVTSSTLQTVTLHWHINHSLNCYIFKRFTKHFNLPVTYWPPATNHTHPLHIIYHLLQLVRYIMPPVTAHQPLHLEC